jgi:hypothetical protein
VINVAAHHDVAVCHVPVTFFTLRFVTRNNPDTVLIEYGTELIVSDILKLL